MKNVENGTNSPKANSFKLVISKISIRIKFNCWLFIEYTIDGCTKRTSEIKVDPKEKNYFLQEEIKVTNDQASKKQDQILIYVKLISGKGVSFTAGIFTIFPKDLVRQGSTFKCPLNKPIDPQSYVQYYVSSPLKEDSCIQNYLPSFSTPKVQSAKTLTQDSNCNSDLKLKVRELQLQLESVKAAYELLKLRNARQLQQKSVNNSKDALLFSKEHKKVQQMFEETKRSQKEHLNRIEALEAQLSKSSTLIQNQKQIIQMLQISKKQLTQQKAQLKAQLKSNQNELQQKRVKLRELQSEKLNLMMNVLTNEKETSFMRERVYENIVKMYKIVAKITKEKTEPWSLNKLPSQSASGWRKEGQSETSYKMNMHTHRYIVRDDLPWLEQSQAYKEIPGLQMSSSSAMNDISISNIKEKNKDEISLLNSGMFVKGSQTLNKTTQNHILKNVSDQVRLYTSKVIQMVTNYHIKCQRQIVQLKQIYKQLCEHNNQYQRNQQSLLGHLQQLEGGLQSQLELVNQKEKALGAAQEAISSLEFQLQEKTHVISQLQAAIFTLQEEKQELKRDIHENNYAYAKRQEQLMYSLKNVQVSPTKNNSPFSLIKSKRETKKEAVYSSQQSFDSLFYKKQILDFRQKVKTLELQLSHQRHQAKQLRYTLQNSQGERRKLQFAMKLKQRMQVLNQSIQISHQDVSQACKEQRQEGKKPLNAYQQQILRVLI